MNQMAKMFYTTEEAAEKLGKTTDEVTEMANSGQIQEFRDKDKVMFKVDQIDLLAGGDDDLGEIPISLEESGEQDPLSLSGSAPAAAPEAEDDFTLELSASGAIGLEDSAVEAEDSFLGASDPGSGVSAFESDSNSEDTSGELLDSDLSLETVGSGSGLLDLTRESDDTSLGAELLDEVYANDENEEIPASASGLFEAADAESSGATAEVGTAMPMGSVPMVVETYEGGWSGLSVGVSLVGIGALCIVGMMAFVGATDTLAPVAEMISDQMLVWVGSLVGGLFVLGLLGFFIGKASE
ncbi:MAG: helix-turn-helix domain-containing protein [Phycisphaerales bacterium]|nr:helix-turn-helix domain-containing protein [Phycisphaerales bacterium]